MHTIFIDWRFKGLERKIDLKSSQDQLIDNTLNRSLQNNFQKKGLFSSLHTLYLPE